MSQDDDAPPIDPLERADLQFLLGMSFQLLHTKFVEDLHEAGYSELRPVHGMVFQGLVRGAETSTELAELLGITKQAAGQIVEYLEELGYVLREDHPAGGRRRLVVLTDKARTFLGIAGNTLAKLEERLGSELETVNVRDVRTALARIIRCLAGDEVPPLRPVW